MGITSTAFSYKPGSSFMHRCPVWLKLLLIPAISVAVFKLPPAFSFAFFLIQMIFAFVLRFTLREQLRDLRAVLYYAFFLIFAKGVGFLAAGQTDFLSFVVFEKETWLLLLKLFCVMQTASLLFKTSTSLQIREGLEAMELTVRKVFCRKQQGQNLQASVVQTPIAQAVSLFICFIPQVSKNWQQAELAWRARGGKKSLRMFVVLLPVFFSVGMKQAYNSARAISARR